MTPDEVASDSVRRPVASMILTDDEWRASSHPPRSPRGYVQMMANMRAAMTGYHEVLADEPPGSPEAAADMHEMGVAAYRLGRIVVDAVESGLISADEAAACMSLDDEADRAVRRRLWLLGCDCDLCARLRASGRDPYADDRGRDGDG